ncbi:hypothetical protein V5E97_37760 [Singulisphaera sp. Ch08]|uniref:Glycosyltransferase RgtA/B/C/D-like domain-containing protein n=1 Tax=Singulisphaera sp. Ch08 TaxID=3120278 RepID=A0AAU7CH78_9BACT
MRRLTPGMPDLVFGVVLVTVLIGGRTGLLNDPGTFWHVRLGREIMRTGDVPRFDTLTYTKERTPWVDQSWAFDLALAAVVDRGGWSTAIAVTSLALAAFYGSLARRLMREGIAPIIAAVVTILVVGMSTIHFLIRPHLFTLLFVFWMLQLCQRQHERGGWTILLAPWLMVPWANIHGGFLAGPLILLTAGFGHAISGPWNESKKRNLLIFAAAFVLCLLTPLINPYGIGLYRHVFHLLRTSGVTQLIQEYQPIPFGKPEFRVVEWFILALIALPTFSSRRMSRYDLTHSLVWLHFALGSVRHVPLFAIVVAPGLAKLLDGLPLASRDLGRNSARWTLWPMAISAGVFLALVSGISFGGFSPEKWPLNSLAILDQQPVESRLFHEQDWGGLIEAECRPVRQAYVDDRFELFGKASLLNYFNALQGGPDWDELQAQEQFRLVWIKPERGLAKRLTADPQWQTLSRDSVSVLFGRKADQPGQRSSDQALGKIRVRSDNTNSSGGVPRRGTPPDTSALESPLD